jgi:hypothetical protein
MSTATGTRTEIFRGLGRVWAGRGCFSRYRFWNDTFRSKLPFVFSEIEGPIYEGFANGNGSYSRAVAVSKGCGGRSVFNSPLKHGLRGCSQSLNSGSIAGNRASPRPDRPVSTNPIHLDVPACRTLALGSQLAGYLVLIAFHCRMWKELNSRQNRPPRSRARSSRGRRQHPRRYLR